MAAGLARSVEGDIQDTLGDGQFVHKRYALS